MPMWNRLLTGLKMYKFAFEYLFLRATFKELLDMHRATKQAHLQREWSREESIHWVARARTLKESSTPILTQEQMRKKKKNQVRRCINAEEDLGKIQQENHMQKLHGPLPKLTGRNRKWFCMREREPQLLMYQWCRTIIYCKTVKTNTM